MFGGSGGVLRTIGKQLVGLDGMYVPREDGRWTWQHSDLALRAWYRDVGSEIPFDVLHLVEWDLLLAAPLQTLYGHVPTDGVGLTALTPVAELEQEWTWLRKEPGRSEWHRLLALARDEFGYDGVPYGCVFGGSCFSRAFLQAYASIEPPRLAHDELRVPLFAQILGFPLVDTRLRGPWHGEREDPYFHFRAPEIELDAIRAQLAEPDGWRAFHPVRAKIDAEVLLT